MRKRHLRVEVIERPQPIDLEAWLRVLARAILTTNGIPIRNEAVEPEPMRQAS